MVFYLIYGVAEGFITLESPSHARISNHGLTRVKYNTNLGEVLLTGHPVR